MRMRVRRSKMVPYWLLFSIAILSWASACEVTPYPSPGYPGILEDSADMLLNVNMVEVELAAKNVKLKKGMLRYNPYTEENVNDLGNVMKQELLSKYDKGEEKKAFVLRASPSHGDLRLCPSGLVMIYMGPDGTNSEHMWGTFSGHISHQEYVQNTLCQQFGYAEGNLSFRHSSNELNDYPVWISGVECDSTYQHILRCNCTPTDAPNTAQHTDDWHLSCSKEVRSGNAYRGQVALIPPTDVNYKFYTKSFGVVVFLEENKQWRYIVKDNSSLDIIADTACRAMGFTHVVRNSVTTVKQYTETYGSNDSFLTSMKRVSAGSVDCSESFRCLGCCNFNPPNKVNFAKDYAMVVRCSFYEPTPHNPLTSGGYEDICETGSHIGEHCKSKKMYSFSSKEFIPTVITLAFFSSAGVVAFCWLVWKCGRQCWQRIRQRHREYNNINDNNDNNVAINDENQEGGEGGNGGGHNLNCCFPGRRQN